jgi:hypothetical protein
MVSWQVGPVARSPGERNRRRVGRGLVADDEPSRPNLDDFGSRLHPLLGAYRSACSSAPMRKQNIDGLVAILAQHACATASLMVPLRWTLSQNPNSYRDTRLRRRTVPCAAPSAILITGSS